jgi:hypothetical protein
MKENKRALRRWKSKCKFEKRLKMWVSGVEGNSTYAFVGKYDDNFPPGAKLGGHYIEELKDKARKGEFWNFLKWTSTPCSCSMCSYPKYERTPKSKIDKKIWDDIQDDLAT